MRDLLRLRGPGRDSSPTFELDVAAPVSTARPDTVLSGYLARETMSSITAAQYAIRASDWNGGNSVGGHATESGRRSGIGEKLRSECQLSIDPLRAEKDLRPIGIRTSVEQPLKAVHV